MVYGNAGTVASNIYAMVFGRVHAGNSYAWFTTGIQNQCNDSRHREEKTSMATVPMDTVQLYHTPTLQASAQLLLGTETTSFVTGGERPKLAECRRRTATTSPSGTATKKLVLSLLLRLCDGVIPLASFCGLISCWTGYTATSMPSMILAGLCFHDTGNDDNNDDSAEGTAGSSTVPLLQVEYAHRRWLQREILATAQILLAGLWVMPRIWNPLIQEWFLQPCWRQLKTITHHVVASTKERCISTNDSNANIPNTAACPRCQRHPICIPFQTSCGHCYCYHCLYLESIQGGDHPEPVYCRICSSIIHSARPWQAD